MRADKYSSAAGSRLCGLAGVTSQGVGGQGGGQTSAGSPQCTAQTLLLPVPAGGGGAALGTLLGGAGCPPGVRARFILCSSFPKRVQSVMEDLTDPCSASAQQLSVIQTLRWSIPSPDKDPPHLSPQSQVWSSMASLTMGTSSVRLSLLQLQQSTRNCE